MARFGPPQVDAHQPGKNHANQHRHQGQAVILLADDFVVQAEDVLPDEAGRRRMVCHVSVRCIVHMVTSNEISVAADMRRITRHCIAACFFSQSSKSSCDITERYAFML